MVLPIPPTPSSSPSPWQRERVRRSTRRDSAPQTSCVGTAITSERRPTPPTPPWCGSRGFRPCPSGRQLLLLRGEEQRCGELLGVGRQWLPLLVSEPSRGVLLLREVGG